MSDRIEVIKPARHRFQIDLSADDTFEIPQWSCEHIAKRIDDATTAVRDDRIGVLRQIRNVVGRIVATTAELIA